MSLIKTARLIKEAYGMKQFQKSYHAARKAGKHIRRHMDQDAATNVLSITKGTGIGPAATIGKKMVSGTPLTPLMKNLKEGMYIKGSPIKTVSKMTGGATQKVSSGKTKHQVNSLMNRHEMDELKSMKQIKKSLKHMGKRSKGKKAITRYEGTSHAAPSVILRESNNVHAAGKGTKENWSKAKAYMKDLRSKGGESAGIANDIKMGQAPARPNKVFSKKTSPVHKEFKYGEQRFSRHAIKNIDKMSVRQRGTAVYPLN